MVRKMSEERDTMNESEEDYDLPEIKIQWTYTEKITAKIICWGLMGSIIIMIIGGLWSLIDISLLGAGVSSFFDFFLELTTGIQLLLITSALAGILFLGISFIVFIKKGYKFFLHFLFKIEE